MATPKSNGNLVQLTAGTDPIPANRPLDHARRLGAALALGIVIGTVGGILFLDVSFTTRTLVTTLVISFVLLIACAVPWGIRPQHKGQGIPVVARTLGTRELPSMRYVHRGTGRAGLLVPVVVHPLDGSSNFRSVILITDVDSQNPQDPPIGTLLALTQLKPGVGELVSSDVVTKEQADMMERLRKHPRELSNNASPLPLRRGPLERTPWWAALQWWGGIAAGLAGSLILVFGIAG